MELAHQLMQHLGAGRWQIGVGRTHQGVQGLATSLDEARDTLDLAARLGFTAPVLNAADLLVFPVLRRDRDAITDLVTTVLGPLIEAHGRPQPYLERSRSCTTTRATTPPPPGRCTYLSERSPTASTASTP